MNKRRVRMIAGPNGSGKSTLKKGIEKRLIGTYINADEIEEEIRKSGFLDLSPYGVKTSNEEALNFFRNSSFLKQAGLIDETHNLRFSDNKLLFNNVKVNAYFASVAADFIRHQLLETCDVFTFETVMSSPDKIEFLKKAQKMGCQTYLYYVATEDPLINILRVKSRVINGGHPVPEDKIIARYHRSLDLLVSAVHATNRAYIFDNTLNELRWIAEITDGKKIELKTSEIPAWLQRVLGEKFINATANS